jgi:hypothetical protein
VVANLSITWPVGLFTGTPRCTALPIGIGPNIGFVTMGSISSAGASLNGLRTTGATSFTGNVHAIETGSSATGVSIEGFAEVPEVDEYASLMADRVLTCQTPGCHNEGIPITLFSHSTTICGVCCQPHGSVVVL